jgi:hypothetical protein
MEYFILFLSSRDRMIERSTGFEVIGISTKSPSSSVSTNNAPQFGQDFASEEIAAPQSEH